MGVSLSNNDICQFALERNVMDYISVQQCLSELTDAKYLECTKENGATRYSISPDGSNALGFFQNRITEWLKSAANDYILNNRQRIEASMKYQPTTFPK